MGRRRLAGRPPDRAAAGLALTFALILGLAEIVNSITFDEAGCTYNSDTDEADCRSLGLVEIPTGVPTNTKALLLANNQLTRITRNDLGDLTKVEKLDAQSNLITVLATDSLETLANLQILNLADNDLTTLQKDLLSSGSRKKPVLRELDLSQNSIVSVERASLFYLSKLEMVDLSHNGLNEENFWKGTFYYLSGIKTVSLAGNSFSDVTALNPIFFRACAKMETLDFSDNELTLLPVGMLSTQSKLASLDLRGNDIEFIAHTFFDPLVSLKVLMMEGNPSECATISSCPADAEGCSVTCSCDADSGFMGDEFGFCDVSTTVTTSTVTESTATTATSTTVMLMCDTANCGATLLPIADAATTVCKLNQRGACKKSQCCEETTVTTTETTVTTETTETSVTTSTAITATETTTVTVTSTTETPAVATTPEPVESQPDDESTAATDEATAAHRLKSSTTAKPGASTGGPVPTGDPVREVATDPAPTAGTPAPTPPPTAAPSPSPQPETETPVAVEPVATKGPWLWTPSRDAPTPTPTPTPVEVVDDDVESYVDAASHEPEQMPEAVDTATAEEAGAAGDGNGAGLDADEAGNDVNRDAAGSSEEDTGASVLSVSHMGHVHGKKGAKEAYIQEVDGRKMAKHADSKKGTHSSAKESAKKGKGDGKSKKEKKAKKEKKSKKAKPGKGDAMTMVTDGRHKPAIYALSALSFVVACTTVMLLLAAKRHVGKMQLATKQGSTTEYLLLSHSLANLEKSEEIPQVGEYSTPNARHDPYMTPNDLRGMLAAASSSSSGGVITDIDAPLPVPAPDYDDDSALAPLLNESEPSERLPSHRGSTTAL